VDYSLQDDLVILHATTTDFLPDQFEYRFIYFDLPIIYNSLIYRPISRVASGHKKTPSLTEVTVIEGVFLL